MNWQSQIKGDSLNWLLQSENPGVRYLALCDLLHVPQDDPDLFKAQAAAHAAGPIADILRNMQPEGYWSRPGHGYNPKYFSTVWSIILVAQLGASTLMDERVGKACAYLLEHNLTPNGQFTTSGSPSGTVDCLQGNLCWALLELGVAADDPRLKAAFEWMARTVTGEGIASQEQRDAPLRYYAYKCGPNFACGVNNAQSCAWGAAKVMLALGRLPVEHRTHLIEHAIALGLDFLFSVDPVTAAYPSGLNPKPSTSWFKLGFPVFYVTDILQIVEALVGFGCGSDPRLVNAWNWILAKQDSQGRWPLEYDYSGKTWVNLGLKRQPSPWVTLRVLRALQRAGKKF